MTPDESAQYEQALTALEAELKAEVDASGEADTVSLDGSMGRISRVEALHRQQIAREHVQRKRERLVRIQSARLRISQGNYGLCGRCRRPIAPDRLDAFPEVVLCIQCANRTPS